MKVEGSAAGPVPESPHRLRDLVIVNRTALRSSDALVRRLRSGLSEAAFVEMLSPERWDDGRDLAAGRPYDRLVLSGGDGTLCRFLPDVLESDIPVRLVPAGTANDLATAMGIPWGIPSERVLKGESVSVREIDVLRAAGRPYTTVGYLGFGSDVVRTINRLRGGRWGRRLQRLLGRFIYGVGVAWISLGRPLKLYRLKVRSDDGRELDVETPLIVAANQPCVGSTMNLAPGTRNDDGTFRVQIYTQRTGPELLRAIVGLCRGGDPESLGVESFETTRLHVESRGDAFVFCADGEELVEGRELDIDLHPRRLKLIVE